MVSFPRDRRISNVFYVLIEFFDIRIVVLVLWNNKRVEDIILMSGFQIHVFTIYNLFLNISRVWRRVSHHIQSEVIVFGIQDVIDPIL